MTCDVCEREVVETVAGLDAAVTLMCDRCAGGGPPPDVVKQMIDEGRTACLRLECMEFFPAGESCPVHGLPGWLAFLGYAQ